MGTPVQTQLLDLVEERLRSISTANGYSSNLEAIERSKLEPFLNQEMPGINYYYISDTRLAAAYHRVVERQVTIVVEYYDVTRDDIFSDLSSVLSSDLIIALFRDPAHPLFTDEISTNLGGKTKKFEIIDIVPAIGSGQAPYCGAIVTIEANYRVDLSDPFTLITE